LERRIEGHDTAIRSLFEAIGQLAAACQQAGFEMPVICTPRELIVKPVS
jgi:hypothetical protein